MSARPPTSKPPRVNTKSASRSARTARNLVRVRSGATKAAEGDGGDSGGHLQAAVEVRVQMMTSLRIHARSAWATRMMRTCMTRVGCVVGLLCLRPDVLRVVGCKANVGATRKCPTCHEYSMHQSMCRTRKIPSGFGSWCTTDRQGATLMWRRTTLVSCTAKV